MNYGNTIVMMLILTSSTIIISDTQLYDLSADPNAPEIVASPSCDQIRRNCEPGYPDIKRMDQFEHCVTKNLKNICRKNYSQPDQSSLYNTCIQTNCLRQDKDVDNSDIKKLNRGTDEERDIANAQLQDVDDSELKEAPQQAISGEPVRAGVHPKL